MDPWAPYHPTAADPWDARKVGHLHRRAGFGPSPTDLARDLADGPDAAISRLLVGGADPDADAASDFLASDRSLPAGADGVTLAAWWLHRILHTPHPLREKLTLFWHGHFATSHAKVRNARLMLGQYRLLHQHALGDFRQLLRSMATDPAMLVWLDGAGSAAGKPNENYARELMELFSLGIGHYTEADIREAAKAFTGWDVADGKARFSLKKHDAGPKTVFGTTGNYTADEVTDLCLARPECPRFVCRRLYRFLVSETTDPSPELIDPLARRYADSGFDTGKLVGTVLRSSHFFSPAAYRQTVKSPVEFAVGIARGLGGTVGAKPLAEALGPLGQTLFAPPSVKGWDAGPAWLNAQTLLARQNLALTLTAEGGRCDPVAALSNQADPADRLLATLLQGDAPAGTRDRLLAAPPPRRRPGQTAADAADARLRALAHLVLTLPEYQLN